MGTSKLFSILTKEEAKINYQHSEEGLWRLVFPRLVQNALRRLFENKHLYQSVEVGDDETVELLVDYWRDLAPSSGGGAGNGSTFGTASTRPGPAEHPDKKLRAEYRVQRARTALGKVLAAPWRAEVLRSPDGRHISGGDATFGAAAARGDDEESAGFAAPRAVRAHCHDCGARTAFNPVSFFGFGAAAGWTGSGRSEDEQHFGYSYECQQCPGPARGRVVFLVVRRGGKITLCGREPLEVVPVENYIPKPLRPFISGALIAHHAGQTLSGLFQLRTFIEQFWRSQPDVEGARLEALREKKRLAGDELAEAYSKLLPESFKQQFSSLGKIYSNLSEAMHDAKRGDEAAAVFTAALEGINEHFDARRLFKLDQQKSRAGERRLER